MLEPKSHTMKLLLLDQSPELLLRFFLALEEELTAAAADAHSAVPQATNPSAKQARGALRRHFMHEGLEKAARRCEIEMSIGWTNPKTWCYPILRIGAFTFTLGAIYSKYFGSKRALRTKAKYVRQICSRNAALDPQFSIFVDERPKVSPIIPGGTYGALFVAEHSNFKPDIPSFLGLWIPSNDLSSAHHVQSLGQIIAELRDLIASGKKPARKALERKMPKVRTNKRFEK